MLNKKKLGLLVLSVCTIASMAACSNKKAATSSEAASVAVSSDDGKKHVSLKVWAPTEEAEVMTTLIANFKTAEATAHPDVVYEIEHVAMAEGDTKAELLKDPNAAADVFATTDDSCQVLAASKNVYEIPQGSTYYTNATTLNASSTVAGVTLNGKVYGFPETADNGFFLMYNSNFITDEEAGSLDAIVAKAKTLGKKVYYPYKNSWYAVSYMNIGEAKLGHDEDGDYCNWAEKSIDSFKAMYTLGADTTTLQSVDANADVQAGLNDGSVVAAVTGTWNYDGVKDLDGLKCTKMPTLKVNGEAKQLSSFSGGKVVCVNSVTKNPTEAMRFADYMTNEAAQTLRFNKRSIGPSNIAAANTDAVKANIALNALAAQSEYAISQSATMSTTLNSNYWDAAAALGAHIETQDLADDAAILAAVTLCQNAILGVK